MNYHTQTSDGGTYNTVRRSRQQPMGNINKFKYTRAFPPRTPTMGPGFILYSFSPVRQLNTQSNTLIMDNTYQTYLTFFLPGGVWGEGQEIWWHFWLQSNDLGVPNPGSQFYREQLITNQGGTWGPEIEGGWNNTDPILYIQVARRMLRQDNDIYWWDYQFPQGVPRMMERFDYTVAKLITAPGGGWDFSSQIIFNWQLQADNGGPVWGVQIKPVALTAYMASTLTGF